MADTPYDPRLTDALWRGADLTRAYVAQDRAWAGACLTGLDTDRLELVFGLLVLTHDELFGEFGEPLMTVRVIDTVAALAPLDVEFVATTAVRRVVAKEVGLAAAVEALALLSRIHTVAICTAVMLLEALGSAGALEQLDEDAAAYERKGHSRPYPLA